MMRSPGSRPTGRSRPGQAITGSLSLTGRAVASGLRRTGRPAQARDLVIRTHKGWSRGNAGQAGRDAEARRGLHAQGVEPPAPGRWPVFCWAAFKEGQQSLTASVYSLQVTITEDRTAPWTRRYEVDASRLPDQCSAGATGLRTGRDIRSALAPHYAGSAAG
jgi:hypothetical protein